MLASSPTMSASGTDHTSGTNAKMSRPSPGPTEWISVSVVYGPPEVEKKRTETSPSVPIARGSFCLIDHASMTTQTSAPKYLRKAGTQETFSDSPAKSKQWRRLCFVLFSRGLCVVVLVGLPVTLCPQ